MSEHHLATYLNDHLAGFAAAHELLELLAKEPAHTPVARLARELRPETETDRKLLESVIAKLDAAQSLPRKAIAWISELMTDLKRLDDPGGGGALRLLEILEALSLEIEGKRSLWRVLEKVSEVKLAIRMLDYTSLQQRAESQREKVETLRLKMAKEAFGPPPIAEKG